MDRVADEAAAELLLTAEHMLSLHPTRESLKCARAEALILCRRYGDALEACRTLMPGSIDAAYLTSEAYWRMGRLNAAAAALSEVGKRVHSDKCAELLSFVTKLKARWTSWMSASAGRPPESDKVRRCPRMTSTLWTTTMSTQLSSCPTCYHWSVCMEPACT